MNHPLKNMLSYKRLYINTWLSLYMEKEVGGKEQIMDHTELFRGSAWLCFNISPQQLRQCNEGNYCICSWESNFSIVLNVFLRMKLNNFSNVSDQEASSGISKMDLIDLYYANSFYTSFRSILQSTYRWKSRQCRIGVPNKLLFSCFLFNCLILFLMFT